MNDPRVLDFTRQTFHIVTAIAEHVRTLKEDNKYLKEQVREMRKTITRKYGKNEPQS